VRRRKREGNKDEKRKERERRERMSGMNERRKIRGYTHEISTAAAGA